MDEERLPPLPRLPPIAHYLGGTFAALVAPNYPLAAIFVVSTFLVYEVVEFWALHDEAYVDIKQFIIGLFSGSVARLLLDILLGSL